MHEEQRRALDYLARKGTHAPVERLRAQVREAFATIESAFDAVGADDRERAPAPGKWSPHEILDHLVLSHAPAVAQFESLLAGIAPAGDAVRADLHRDERPSWDELRGELSAIHRRFESLLDKADDDVSLEAKAPVVMVIKIDGAPKHWIEHFDWKAFVQTIRVHTLEHHRQLLRCAESEAR